MYASRDAGDKFGRQKAGEGKNFERKRDKGPIRGQARLISL